MVLKRGAGDARYKGREQTYVKHFVLQKYLERFARIVGTKWPTINYVDCFSGPWQAATEDLGDTSFALALEVLRSARETLHRRGGNIRLRAFFIEKDELAFRRLNEFADKTKEDVEVVTKNAEFETAIPAIQDFLHKARNSFSFIFIDPTGWTGFALNRIRPLLREPNSEVLINFMTSFVRRFVVETSTEADLARGFEDLFGRPDFAQKLAGLPEEDREDAIIETYKDAVKQAAGYRIVCSTPVLNPTKDTTHFHLVYGTRSPKGLEVFKDAERVAMQEMETVRADAQQQQRQDRSRQTEMFGPKDMHRVGYYEHLRDRYIDRSRRRIEALLTSRKRVHYDVLWESALNEQLVLESDLKDWITRWRKDGRLFIAGLRGKERMPQRGKGHVIVWKP